MFSVTLPCKKRVRELVINGLATGPMVNGHMQLSAVRMV